MGPNSQWRLAVAPLLSEFVVAAHWPINLFLPQKGLATCFFPVCLFPATGVSLPRGDRMARQLSTDR